MRMYSDCLGRSGPTSQYRHYPPTSDRNAWRHATSDTATDAEQVIAREVLGRPEPVGESADIGAGSGRHKRSRGGAGNPGELVGKREISDDARNAGGDHSRAT